MCAMWCAGECGRAKLCAALWLTEKVQISQIPPSNFTCTAFCVCACVRACVRACMRVAQMAKSSLKEGHA